jgi:hypothetical protein
MTPLPPRIGQILIASANILACALLAGTVHALVGTWGRDLRPTAAVMGLLLAAAAFYLAGWRRYPVASLLAALLLAELLLIAAIGWFAYGGLPRLDNFFRSWFINSALIIALPWLIGMMAGSARSRSLR